MLKSIYKDIEEDLSNLKIKNKTIIYDFNSLAAFT